MKHHLASFLLFVAVLAVSAGCGTLPEFFREDGAVTICITARPLNHGGSSDGGADVSSAD